MPVIKCKLLQRQPTVLILVSASFNQYFSLHFPYARAGRQQ